MIWQPTLRTTFLSTLALMVISVSILYKANDQISIRSNLQNEAKNAVDYLSLTSVIQLGNSKGFVRSLYEKVSTWGGTLSPVECRNLRVKLCKLYGMDYAKLELEQTKLLTTNDNKAFRDQFDQEWMNFTQWLKEEVEFSVVALRDYLESDSVMYLLGASTSYDQRFQELGGIVLILGKLQQDVNERIMKTEDDRTLKIFFEGQNLSIEELNLILYNYYLLRTNVDAIAFIDKNLSEQGSLVYGKDHGIAPQINVIKAEKIFGIEIEVTDTGVIVLLLINILFSLVLALVVIKCSDEINEPSLNVETNWFLFSFPVWMRWSTLSIPGVLFLINLSFSICYWSRTA